MANVFFVPKFIVSGEGALHMSMDNMKEFGKKALIVTDDMMIKLGNDNLFFQMIAVWSSWNKWK